MKFLTLQGMNQPVSKIVMGTAQFGKRVSPETAFRLMDVFTERGGNCIDTARAYADGESEKVVGAWLTARQCRDKVLISTKGGHPAKDGKPRIGRADLEQDLAISLNALQTDCIDLYWVHKDDPNQPVEEVIDTMNSFVEQGIIHVFGCSNWHIDRIEKANAYAARTGQRGFAASQIQWSLAESFEHLFAQYGAVVMSDEEYQWYLKKNMPVFAFGAQARGFFSTLDAKGLAAVKEEQREQYASPENLQRFERVRAYASAHAASVAEVALAYLINNKLPTVSIIGASSETQLRESMKAAALAMSAADADSLYYL